MTCVLMPLTPAAKLQELSNIVRYELQNPNMRYQDMQRLLKLFGDLGNATKVRVLLQAWRFVYKLCTLTFLAKLVAFFVWE